MVFRCDIVKQFSIATVLHDQEKSLRGLNDFIELNDTRMPHDLEDMNFTLYTFDIIYVLNLPLV